MKVLFAVLALSLCAEVAAQQMFKCKNASGRITYAGSECKDLGLSPAGEIKGQANVMSTQETPTDASSRETATPRPRPVVKEEVPAARENPAGEAPPVTPERRCFTVKTAKGTATRCNDAPPE